MRTVKIKRIIYVNNEVEKHSAANLLLGEIGDRRIWLCEQGTPKGIAILELECRTLITAIRIGNAYSAFVEILVGNLGDPPDKYQTLIPPTELMTYQDSRLGRNSNRVKFFLKTDFRRDVAHKEWEVIQLVCTQPFNRGVDFGICFILVTGPVDDLVIVPESKKEEKTSSAPNIKKIESKERERKTAEEKSKSKTSSKIKTSPIKITSSSRGDKSKQSPSQDYPDNRRNKYIGLEGSLARKKEMEGTRVLTYWVRDRELQAKKEFRRRLSQENRPGTRRRFSRLMEDVFFTISGFKNPERAEIRTKALQMGAKFASDWNSVCTHLICACMNTPKYHQVKGKGCIVSKEWIQANFEDRKRYPWRRYALDPFETTVRESEEEISAEDSSDDERNLARPGPSSEPQEKRARRDENASSSDDDSGEKKLVIDESAQNSDNEAKEIKPEIDDPDLTETDTESLPDTNDLYMPYLPDLLAGKVFYLDKNLENYRYAYKYIIAYDGDVRSEMSPDVDFYITETGGEPLKIFRRIAPKMKAIRPDWIWAMNRTFRWVSPWPFMLSP